MDVDSWDEIRTAYQVARLGTVSAAAAALGVHHATVIRHIDALEKKLGAKLFQRHARGYTPTEAGLDLLGVGGATERQLQELVGRIKGRGATVSGELIVTTVSSFSGLLASAIATFEEQHPEIVVRIRIDQRVLKLEYGEAHVAVRAGTRPNEPDNVVRPFVTPAVALYAARRYVARHGKIEGLGDLPKHRFVGFDDAASRAPFNLWLRQHVEEGQITTRSNDINTLYEAIHAGCGAGFMPVFEAEKYGDALYQLMPPRPEWSVPTWLVTHVDLHRTPKVQAFLSHLREASRNWATI
ncbi:MAG: LysR family transcriptional regulator [Alphaproteobacteria bacterium]|nr:MAG: LysR family transcriptional regulator [Alphaproteobacteria bacterium]